MSLRGGSYQFEASSIIIPKDGRREDVAFHGRRSYLGVADGVGGWAEVGIDAGQYSGQLMSNVIDIIRWGQNIPPLEVLRKAYGKIMRLGTPGSSTCCLVFLKKDTIHSINLGDSGFILYRPSEKSILHKSKFQTHQFNFPLQLGKQSLDRPEDGEMLIHEVRKGDLVMLATDGVWDNLYDYQLRNIFKKYKNIVDGNINDMVTEVADTALEYSMNSEWLSPYAKTARAEGLAGAIGGKPDDISVVIARVCKSYQRSSDVELHSGKA